MSGRCDHTDCTYDYDNSWDYECSKPRHRRRHSKKLRNETRWGYQGW